MSLWTADDIARATGGQASAPFTVTGVSIDTRTLEPGDLFVALAGVRDGHEFLDAAFSAGAAGALVSQPVEGRPTVRVDGDVLLALERLGQAGRDRSAARRGAVTGSVGKTSVTQAIAAGLRLAGPAHSSVKSYNNHIGVPLTLARMPADTQRAVFEIGMNHAGEITPLSRMVRPHAALVTTVGPVHVENFPDGETGVAHAKAEIFDGLQPGGTAVLNADDRWFDLLSDAARNGGADIVAFGSAPGCTARLLSAEPGQGGAGLTVHAELRGRPLTVNLLQSGVHWGLNSLAALLMLEALDVPLETATAALEAFAPLEGRGAERTVAVEGGAFLLIDESYNANPLSMRAAIRSLGGRPGARRLIALTDMLELGVEAPRFHAELAPEIKAANLDLVFCAGPLMAHLFDALPSTRRGGYAPGAGALAPALAAAVRPGDVVMVKGSNGSKASLLARALTALSLPKAS